MEAPDSANGQRDTVKRSLGAYGPSIVVLLTVAAVLWAGPRIVRELTYARTAENIRLASSQLLENDILEQINQAHRNVAIKVEPSVVYISTRRDFEPRIDQRRPTLPLSSGSGWVYDDEGHVVTNAHVIEEYGDIEVQLNTGEIRPATVIGVDLRTDIAVLKIEPGLLHPADRADSRELRQGDRVFAFGSPFDFRFSMSQGIVSGIGRDAQLQTIQYRNFIQVDAAINPGNSGGPLTDIYGRVVGMNTAIATGTRGSLNEGVFSGIGLAIPMEMIESVVNQLIEKGEVSRGFIGVELHPSLEWGTARDRGFLGEGVEVEVVTAGGPADSAGLEPGDVITAVDGRPVASVAQVRSIISSQRPGAMLTLDVWHFVPDMDQPRQVQVAVTLTELDPMVINPQIRWLLGRLGFGRLSTSSPERASEYGATHHRGVLVEEVELRSGISNEVRPGDIIVQFAGDPVQNVDEFYARLERAVAAREFPLWIQILKPDGDRRVVELSP